MKRLLQITLALLLFIGLSISALPLLLSTETMRERIIAHVSSITSGKVSFQSNPAISFNPFLGIEISDFKIQDPVSGNANNNLITVEKVKARLDILPALVGKITISEYQLVRPKLTLKIYTDGKGNWEPQDTKLAEIIGVYGRNHAQPDDNTNSPDDLNFGKFNIVDGLIEFEDLIAGKQRKYTGIDGSFNWPTTTSPASFSGVAVWQGEILNTDFTLNEPLKLSVGGESDISISIKSNPINLTFKGQANMLSNLFVSGEMEFDTPSINRITEFLQLDLGGYTALQNVSAQGKLEATAESLTLTDAQVSIDENSGSGVLTITSDELGNKALDGTLAFDQINADPFLGLSLDGGNNHERDTATGQSSFSSDLRLSANSVTAGALNLTQVAASIDTNGFEWTFDISDASIFGGQIIAQLGERKIDDKYQNFINVNARKIDTEELLKLFPENTLSLSGTSDFQAELSTNYNLETSLIGRLNGMVNLEIENGSIIGLDLPAMVRSTENNDNQQYVLDANEQTPFAKLATSFALHNGLAYIANTTIQNEESKIKLAGSINLSNDAWVLRAVSDAENTRSILMGGTIKAPLILYNQDGPEITPLEAQSEDLDNDVSN